MQFCGKKVFLLLVFSLFLSVGYVNAGDAATAEIVIFHTNDMHGRVVGNGESIIGIDRIAAIHKSVPNSILVDAGDAVHGLPIATLGRGGDIVSLMNEAGYDGMVVGNHEFNYGFDRLVELRDMAQFPIMSSNIMKDGEPFMRDTAMIEINGVKIGLFGITTESGAHTTMPRYVEGLVFEDAVTIAGERAKSLREQGAHVVVALCHLGVVPEQGTLSTELARAVPEIDVIVDGHSHTKLDEGLLENGVLIVQTGDYENSLGKVTVTLENGLITSKTATLISCEEAQDTEPDEAVAARIAEIITEQEAVLQQVVGESKDAMSSARAPGVRTQEMPLGSLVADAYRSAAETEISIVNGGDIRADFPQGVVTRGDIVSVLPFGNTLMVKTVTPALLRAALENGVSNITTDEQGSIDHEQSASGRFLHASGFSYAFDPTAPSGERVISITLDDGAELSLDDNVTRITVVGSNFVMTGGDQYTMLSELQVDRELGAADEALAEYVLENSPIEAPEEGRIIITTAEEMENAA